MCPMLLSPEIEALSVPRPRRHPRAARLAESMAPLLAQPGALCVLDLEPLLGVQVAARLAALAHPVLLLPRWPYSDGVLPCDRLAATLLAEARSLPAEPRRLPNVLFVIDAERGKPLPNRPRADTRADNRHALSIFDLPDLKTLRARGIQRIHRIAAA
jgi:hypothetical protein